MGIREKKFWRKLLQLGPGDLESGQITICKNIQNLIGRGPKRPYLTLKLGVEQRLNSWYPEVPSNLSYTMIPSSIPCSYQISVQIFNQIVHIPFNKTYLLLDMWEKVFPSMFWVCISLQTSLYFSIMNIFLYSS